MPTAREGLAVGVINGILYAVGGWTNFAYPGINTVEAYDPATDTWTTKAPMPTARGGLAAGGINGIPYATGGTSTGSFAMNIVEAYNPATNTWVRKNDMPTARFEHAVGVVNGKLYAVGGTADGVSPLTTVIATVTKSSINGTFVVTGVSPGTTFVTVYDTMFNSASVKVTVQ